MSGTQISCHSFGTVLPVSPKPSKAGTQVYACVEAGRGGWGNRMCVCLCVCPSMIERVCSVCLSMFPSMSICVYIVCLSVCVKSLSLCVYLVCLGVCMC